MDACTTPDELKGAMLDFVQAHGFRGFTFSVHRRLKSLYLMARALLGWPGDFNDRYFTFNPIIHDPVHQRARLARAPFAWDLSIYDLSLKEHAGMAALRREMGMSGGICVPTAGDLGTRWVLYLGGDGFPRCADTLLALRLFAQHAAARLNAMPDLHLVWIEPLEIFPRNTVLTAREREVLGWIAFGKSSRDIATIMKLSEHTVNEYISGASTKLQASNRTEAVSRALMLDIIDVG
jgi:LuxR family quorum sensing-dependent transcriptional regulator